MKNKRLVFILIALGSVLMIPLIAMQFTPEVNWSPFDFMIMGVLLLLVGLACEFILRRVQKTSQRIIWCGVIIASFLLIWAELAVGIFGTPFGGS